MSSQHQTAPTEFVEAAGIRFAYKKNRNQEHERQSRSNFQVQIIRFPSSAIPLVLSYPLRAV